MMYHIARSTAWQAAQPVGQYTGDTLVAEGFIHCSDAQQVARVANARFHNERDLVVLIIDPTQLTAETRYEIGDSVSQERFPHCYGAINVSAVIRAEPLLPDATGIFYWPHG